MGRPRFRERDPAAMACVRSALEEAGPWPFGSSLVSAHVALRVEAIFGVLFDSGMPSYDVFLCHTKQSTEKGWVATKFVQGLYNFFTHQLGWKPFFDVVSLPGQSIGFCLDQAKDCRILMVILDDRMPTEWCQKEINAALGAGIPIQTIYDSSIFHWDKVGKNTWREKTFQWDGQDIGEEAKERLVQGAFSLPALEYNSSPHYEAEAQTMMVKTLDKLLPGVIDLANPKIRYDFGTKSTLVQSSSSGVADDTYLVSFGQGRISPRSQSQLLHVTLNWHTGAHAFDSVMHMSPSGETVHLTWEREFTYWGGEDTRKTLRILGLRRAKEAVDFCVHGGGLGQEVTFFGQTMNEIDGITSSTRNTRITRTGDDTKIERRTPGIDTYSLEMSVIPKHDLHHGAFVVTRRASGEMMYCRVVSNSRGTKVENWDAKDVEEWLNVVDLISIPSLAASLKGRDGKVLLEAPSLMRADLGAADMAQLVRQLEKSFKHEVSEQSWAKSRAAKSQASRTCCLS